MPDADGTQALASHSLAKLAYVTLYTDEVGDLAGGEVTGGSGLVLGHDAVDVLLHKLLLS